MKQEQKQESTKSLENFSSVVEICNDENINNDVKLLAGISIKTTYENARRSIKKKIQDKNSSAV